MAHSTKKAFAYLRVSGKGQVEGDGFPRQRAAIQAYAKQHNLRIAEEFSEEGITGARETMDRPAWARLMAQLHADGVRTVIVEKLDRLARDLMVQESAIADLKRYGFTLISVYEPDLMATDPTRILMRQMLGAFSQYEKAQIVAKLRGARLRKKAQTGRCEGRKPYGHYDGEAPVLERLRTLRTDGLSYRRIAEQLNEEGVPPRLGVRWHAFAVQKILARS